MRRLTTFPRLTEAEFKTACTAFHNRFLQHQDSQQEWTSVDPLQSFNTRYLRITRPLQPNARDTPKSDDAEQESEVEESEDEEALPYTPAPAPEALINYDIILSPTYCVPTLYIHILDPLHRFPPTLDTLYQHLVPSPYASQTRDVGVLGGITITDHPISNKPVFFIHPCRTAEVMEASASGRDLEPEAYLMLWIGAMGKCVGLDVPPALALASSKTENKRWGETRMILVVN
ncbi:hypothetical protein K458DRAFT_301858 [Lentithecium fluviatile CBS 122367]|uniref:Ubiquitin-like-conjugating enzyme ATG10 n=1 Tax=Lentithecium fluviatile CBS 122367 TaxID=1168545 RepID=A0A6G1J3H1_9PLEO|nr:hypothetical protein K458DRAFT_301858 [Lentithecium fluviatile CBS 122367]